MVIMLRVAPLCLAIGVIAAPLAADLQPKTVEAFDRYVRVSEARMTKEVQPGAAFFAVDALPEPRRKAAIDDLRAGGLFIERLATSDGGRKLDAPDALIHHWVGAVFIPGATVDRAVALMQD